MEVFITGDNEAMMGRVRDVAIHEGYRCPPSNAFSLSRATMRFAESQPDLTIVVLSPDPEMSWQCLEDARPKDWGRLLAVGPVSDGRLVVQALRTGIQDYVDDANLEADLRTALGRLKQSQPAATTQGKIIACVPASGGCGASTIAVNVATALAREHKRAALIDLRLEAGDLAPLLDLKPVHTLADLCENPSQVDRNLLDQTLVKHSSGVHLLAAPRHYREIAAVTPEGVRQALLTASSMFDCVVADLGNPAQEIQAEAVRLADTVLLVFRPDFTSLRNARRILEHLDDLGVERDCVRMIANRCGQPREISSEKAAQVLGVETLFFIPEDLKAVNLANNSGVPVLLDSPSARVSKSLLTLAMSVNESRCRQAKPLEAV